MNYLLRLQKMSGLLFMMMIERLAMDRKPCVNQLDIRWRSCKLPDMENYGRDSGYGPGSKLAALRATMTA